VAGNPDIDSVQRTAESQNLEIRQTLWKYESVIEYHRREVYAMRREFLLAGNTLALAAVDDLWSDYLANIAELRGGIHWVSWGGRDPLHSFLTGAQEIYADFQSRLDEEIANPSQEPFERGATWTYLTTDQPFGTLGERITKAILSKRRG
jgi:preprotein translocase subunit SecA